ncbi:MAG TPA: DUF3499 family protein [Acidimicrobiales bacterium]|jgi:hypothetical protein|nr:DUF3499 family protein [Acidimicrobiales bacterium]
MERARLCRRPGCAEPAAAALTFQYAARTVWLDDIGPREPHSIDLCTMHADRVTPPRGWAGEDRRRTAGPAARAAS